MYDKPIIFFQKKMEINIENVFNFYSELSKNVIYVFRRNCNVNMDIHIKKKMYFYDNIFEFSSLYNIFESTDYIFYFDDTWIESLENTKECMECAIDKIERSNSDQVLLSLTNLVSYPRFTVENNLWRQYRVMSEIFVNKKNPYKPKVLDLNYIEYTDNSFLKRKNTFQLIPSLINTDKLLDYLDYLKNTNYWVGKFSSCLNMFNCENSNILCDSEQYSCRPEMEHNSNNITIVTGFLDMKIKRTPKRDTQVYDYIDKSIQTLSIKQNMVIFISEEWVDHAVKIRTQQGLMEKTKIVVVKEDDMYFWNRREDIFKAVENNKPPYNNPYLLMLVNSRYNYLNRAINDNHFGTDFFAWIDFSAGHIVEFPQNCHIKYSYLDKIRISWIARYRKEAKQFKFNHKAMGGGIWVGHKSMILQLIKIHDEEFLKLLNEGFVINDDRLLFFMFEKYPHLFDTYFSSYGCMLTKL